MNIQSLLKNRYVLYALAALIVIFLIISILSKIFWWVAIPVILVSLILVTLSKVTDLFKKI